MRTFEDIYKSMCDKGEDRFSIRELLDIYVKETSWAGTNQQLLNIRSLQHELTGIRPGECSQCNLEVMRNMVRWVTRYEAEHPSEPTPEEKPKRKRIGE